MVLRILFVCFLLICSCDSQSDNRDPKDVDAEQNNQAITAADIATLDYEEYLLGNDAKTAVAGWQNYQELMAQLDFLKQGDLSFFDGQNQLMRTFINDMKATIPKPVATPSIQARLSALETKMLRLHSTLQLSNIKKDIKLQQIEEVLVAISHMHLQMNKKFELESQRIELPD